MNPARIIFIHHNFFVGPDEDGYIDMEVAEYIKNIVIWETK